MPRLRELAEGLGWTDVSTYINSGNLFADCGGASRAQVEKALEAALEEDLGRRVAVVARTRAQLQRVVDATRSRTPNRGTCTSSSSTAHRRRGARPSTPSSRGTPSGSRARHRGVRRLRERRGPLEARLGPGARAGVTGTARNWRTVLTLLEKV